MVNLLGKKKGNSADNKERRLQALEKILDEFDKKGTKPTQNQILEELRKKKFVITRFTLYNDTTELAINDPFVKDLADKTYSKLVHDSFDSINFAEEQARRLPMTEYPSTNWIIRLEYSITKRPLLTQRQM
jgi:hypothetical protein